MKISVLAALALLCTGVHAVAGGRPPAITWEWFNAAVIHQKNSSAGSQSIAAHYFRLAAERGNAAAAYKLGEMWEEGRGLQQSYDQALKWYGMAAGRGDKYALFKLGLFAQKGWGGKQDAALAAGFYAAAGQRGNAWGYHMLAFMLADGEGIAVNKALAIRYLEQSLGFTDDHWAKWKLAVLLRDQDPARARRLMREAAIAGNPEALKEHRAGLGG